MNLLDTGTTWQPSSAADRVDEGRDRETGDIKWTGTSVDPVFGSNSPLRAIAEVYASDDAKEKLVHDFAAAFSTVLGLGRAIDSG